MTSALVIVIFVFGLLIFFKNRSIFTGYKTYYFESYSYVIPYKIKNVMRISTPLTASSMSSSTPIYAQSIPVLLYHGVLGGGINNTNGEATNIDLATFWDQMRTLKENGWQTISIDDFYNFKLGLKKLPEKSFMITFDDGRKDSYYPADPILKALGFHAIMFVIDKYSLEENSNYYLTKDELLKMNASNQWEIQSHGYSSHSEYPIDDTGTKAHFFSNKLWLPDVNRIENENEFVVRIAKDLSQSKQDLETTFSKKVNAFAFPFGDYGQGTINFPALENMTIEETLRVYDLAFYQYSSSYRFSQNYPQPESMDDTFMVKRIGISHAWKGDDLIKIFEHGTAKTLPFIAQMNETDGWINTEWGTMEIKDGTIHMSALPNSTGSTIILDGTNMWKNYTITAKVHWIKGSNVYLESRAKDDNNLAACNFSKELVHVEQIYDGKSRVIAGLKNKFNANTDSFTISMKVNDRTVECSIDGKIIVSTPFLEEPIDHGGVGIKIWDSIPGNSEIVIESVSIDN